MQKMCLGEANGKDQLVIKGTSGRFVSPGKADQETVVTDLHSIDWLVDQHRDPANLFDQDRCRRVRSQRLARCAECPGDPPSDSPDRGASTAPGGIRGVGRGNRCVHGGAGLFTLSTQKSVALSGSLFGLGILLFSGSLYGLVLTQQSWLNADRRAASGGGLVVSALAGPRLLVY